jgi:hypothetical protein
MSVHVDFYKEFSDLKKNAETNEPEEIEDDLIDDDPDSEVINYKKKGKKKKKKFKNDKLDLLMKFDDEDDEEEWYDADDIIMKKPKKGKRELFDLKQAKKKKKKNIEARFSGTLTLFKKVLKDADLTYDNIREIVNNIMASKSRYVGKTLTDLLQALNTANSNRASVIRDIANVNKTIVDLQLKQDKSMGKSEDAKNLSDEDFGAKMFTSLFSGDRREMKKMSREWYASQNYDEDYLESVDEEIQSRLESEENEYRTTDGNSYIKYEQDNPEDVILYHTSGEWETAAVDGHGQRMPDDYPVIPKENLGNVNFNHDDKKATDESGRIYRVIDVP